MIRTILSLWLPHLPTDRLLRSGEAPAAAGEDGRATAARVRNAQRLVSLDAAALAAGLRPGMALADARAARPGLAVHPSDPRADAALLDEVAAWCSRFTPLLALDGADGLLLDITGAAHLFGGDAGVMAAVEEGLGRQGLAAQAAVAPTPEGAWALARFGAVRMAPARDDSKGQRRVFGPLPLAALRLDPETLRVMAQAGLRRIDDVLPRPRAPLAARFGAALFDRLDGVMGVGGTPISPRFEAPPFVAEQRFASPIALEADIERVLRVLADHLCALMEQACQGARQVEARLFRVDGVVKRLTVGTSRPLGRAPDLVRLFRERIASLGEDGLDTGYGFDVVRLGVLVAEPVARRQESLLAGGDRDAGEGLDALVDRLGARLGGAAVTRLAARQTHIPEQAAAAVPAAAGRPARDPAPSLPRPIRLFARPEPIDAIAAVPDGPPLRFRWRRVLHEVAAIEGPERIAPEWWRPGQEDASTRDYFRTEDRDGRQFWLFREGLVVAETPAPRWFVHGLFG